MQEKQRPRTIRLAIVTMLAAFVSLWQQFNAVYAYAGVSSGLLSGSVVVSVGCTIFIVAAVSAFLWRSVHEMKHIGKLAFIDELTGLPNRRRFDARLKQLTEAAGRRKPRLGALYLDLDKFKSINDSYGHEAGDEVIVQFGRRLANILRDGDFLARLSGDEFAMILSNVRSQIDIELIAGRIFAAMSEPIRFNGRQIYAGVSIGAAMLDDASITPAEILRRADFALLQAKENGRNNLQVFDPSMAERIRSRGILENDLREAIIKDRFQIRYQPLVSQRESTILGVEALVRWIHPERGAISPAVFIPIAEEIGMIDRLGEIVLRRACVDIGRIPSISLAVNISPHQFMQRDFVSHVRNILEETGFEPRRLELEITEGVFLTDPARTQETIRQLRELGVRIALDDFGTGYSSMSYLRDYPLDRIKIDRSFVSEIGSSGKSLNLVSRLIELGGSLGLAVTVEGVETEDQFKLLSQSGCELQGFLFSRPVPLEQLLEFCSVGLAHKTDNAPQREHLPMTG